MIFAFAELPSGNVPLTVSVPTDDGVKTPDDAPIEPALPDTVAHVAFCCTPPRSSTHWLVCPDERVTVLGVHVAVNVETETPHAVAHEVAPGVTVCLQTPTPQE
jgi:hypothetical protein